MPRNTKESRRRGARVADAPAPRFNTKLVQRAPGGGWKLRVWKKKAERSRGGRVTRMGQLRVKCGCCDETIVIVYDHELLEIGGVIASVAEWGTILRPLLAGVEPEPVRGRASSAS